MDSRLRQVSLLFLVREDEILLAMKKRGHGAGRWNGAGGKPEDGEPIEQTAVRECQEEIGVTPVRFTQMATLDFHFSEHKAGYNQQVVVYICTEWEGKPTESEEMRPAWHRISDIPFDQMWNDDPYWLPQVLNGSRLRARFEFDDDDQVLNHLVEEIG